MKAGERTKEKFLKAGLRLWPNISALAIANETGYTHASVLYHFPGESLKDAIAEYAVKTGNSRVILQLVAEGHKAIKELSQADKFRHLGAI